MMWTLLPLWILVGCTPELDAGSPLGDADVDADTDADTDTDTDTDADSDADTDTDGPPVVAVLDALSPSLGTNGGGVEVTIVGTDLKGVDQVLFGTTEGSVRSATDTLLSVTTPETLRQGLVDITVAGPNVSGEREDAFTFLEDRTGASGGLAIHSYTRSVGYAVADGEWGASELHLFDGVQAFDVADFIGAPGHCLSASPGAPALDLTDLGMTAVGLASADEASLQLARDSGGSFHTELTAVSEYGPGTAWDVRFDAGDWPGFTLYDAFEPGDSTAFQTPVLGSGTPEIGQGQTFTWSPRGGTWMYITMNLYWMDWWDSGYSYLETRRCLVENTGSWTLPANTFSAWPDHFWDYGYLDITSGEIHENLVPLPDGSEITWLTASLLHAGAYTKD